MQFFFFAALLTFFLPPSGVEKDLKICSTGLGRTPPLRESPPAKLWIGSSVWESCRGNIRTVFNHCEISSFLTAQVSAEDDCCGAAVVASVGWGSPWTTTQMRAAHLNQFIMKYDNMGPNQLQPPLCGLIACYTRPTLAAWFPRAANALVARSPNHCKSVVCK